LLTYLKSHPCVDCGERDPVVLEFDHVDRDDKVGSVSNMIMGSFSLATIKLEMAKCEVRCANCHRKKTSAQLNWFYNQVEFNT